LKLFPNSKLTCNQVINLLKYIKLKQRNDVENITKFNSVETSFIVDDVKQNQIVEKVNLQIISMK